VDKMTSHFKEPEPSRLTKREKKNGNAYKKEYPEDSASEIHAYQ
jgi:hypothetical protein